MTRTKLDPQSQALYPILKKKKPHKLVREAGKGNFIFAVDLELGYADFPRSRLRCFKVDSIEIYSVFLKELIKLVCPSIST